ncbi:uncharacterized protein AMSG_09883 [Thecamonas trahens ATCC 50062]|uniref:PROP1-like PPR domain-containing protein n=1 Tax=Thecamonas trahens ATCC 50062 TaxID=461836 RepID=A0A0L0DP87_THETB|nr:hypothetical protein AMSG_09883 [Thecamonas trahens ATCC 50062]KNC54109.1 hypothetical protein AMSG_09883 [Thecamonas trahens ATCC 50062]|eukprot:XP_013753932.1 hypothetical protein AMSG_09883 [Thecamonas trahens ATCC 50062]
MTSLLARLGGVEEVGVESGNSTLTDKAERAIIVSSWVKSFGDSTRSRNTLACSSFIFSSPMAYLTPFGARAMATLRAAARAGDDDEGVAMAFGDGIDDEEEEEEDVVIARQGHSLGQSGDGLDGLDGFAVDAGRHGSRLDVAHHSSVLPRLNSIDEANEWIHSLASSSRIAAWRRGELLDAMYEDMLLDGILPNEETYHTLMSLSMKQERLDRVQFYFDAMRTAGYAHNVVVHNVLLTALATAGRADDAFAHAQRMRATGIEPNRRSYAILLVACGIAAQLDRAVALFDSLIDAGVEPHHHLYAALINASKSCGDLDRAVALLREAQSAPGVTDPLIVHNAAISAAVELGALDTAFDLYADLERDGLAPNSATYLFLLKGACLHKDVPRLTALYAAMCAAGSPPSRNGYDYLLRGLAEPTAPAGALLDALRDMVGSGSAPMLKTLMALFHKIGSSPRARHDDMLRFGGQSSTPTFASHNYAKRHKLRELKDGVAARAARVNAAQLKH